MWTVLFSRKKNITSNLNCIKGRRSDEIPFHFGGEASADCP